MSAIFADQRLSEAAIRRNRHVLFRIAQSRALPVGLVKSGALNDPACDVLRLRDNQRANLIAATAGARVTVPSSRSVKSVKVLFVGSTPTRASNIFCVFRPHD